MSNSPFSGKGYPFTILILTFVFLVILSFPNTEFSFFGIHFRRIDIFADIRLKKPHAEQQASMLNTSPGAEQSSPQQPSEEDTVKEFAAPPNVKENLDSVQAAMRTKKHLRIAHFGDSMIEGDLVTSDVRNFLQKRYGGSGVGFLPMTSVVAQFRASIRSDFSDNWNTTSLIENKGQEFPFGICGFVFSPYVNAGIPDAGTMTPSWTEFSWKPASATHGLSFKLYYSNLHGFAKIKLLNGTTTLELKTLDTGKTLHAYSYFLAPTVSSIRVEIYTNTSFAIHGVTLDDTSGVAVDNFSLRGNSGLILTRLDYELMRQFDKQLSYDLVILQYGLNAAGPNDTSLSWYTSGMIRVVDYMKSIFPHAAILLVTVGDRDTKIGTDFSTAPCVPYLLKSQYQVAKQTKCDLWNLYTAMGGLNSMRDWVNASPPLAAKDYAHLSPAGAHKVAALMTTFILGSTP